MHVRVLGSGAGGGFPQWNCNCENCSGLRAGTLKGRARTQSSLAIAPGDGSGDSWVLLNASPDIRAQLESFPAIQPARKRRDTGICGIVIVDAQIDHTTGLMTLRECDEALELWCTGLVHEDLTTGYPLINVLSHFCGVNWHEVELDTSFEIPGAPGLRFHPVPLAGEAPPYSPRRHNPQPGDNIGLFIEDDSTGESLFYAPGLGAWEEQVEAHARRASCVLVDGTLWTDDELSRAGVGTKTGTDMGHLRQSGEGGLLGHLEALDGPRKVLIHINNTNPLLDESSEEHARLRAAGVELAYDGMDIRL